MARIVIFGAGKVAEVLYRHLMHRGTDDVAAFTCDAGFLPAERTFQGLPVVEFDDVTKHYPVSEYQMLVAIGYQDLNSARARKCADAKAKGYRLASFISPGAHAGDWLVAGENCLILDNATIEPGTRIGNNVVVWSNALVGHHTVIEDHCWLAGHAVLGGSVHLGARSFVGLGAVVANEVRIGADSFLGASTLVTKCVDEKTVFVARATEPFRLDSERFLKISKIR